MDIASACERWLSARGFSGEAHDDDPDVGWDKDDAQGLLQLASLMGMSATVNNWRTRGIGGPTITAPTEVTPVEVPAPTPVMATARRPSSAVQTVVKSVARLRFGSPTPGRR